LRDRAIDIPALIQHFINLKAKELKLAAIPSIAPGAVAMAMDYHWPGNVRELQNLIERALIINPLGPIVFEHLNASVSQMEPPPEPSSVEYNLNRAMAAHIGRVLGVTKGRINGPGGAAALLGVNPSTLRNRMKKLGIQYGKRGGGHPKCDRMSIHRQ
jgi:DNA-binding NtrC family response regulator